MKGRQVQFGEGTKEGPGEEEELDPGTAHRLYQEGGFLVVSDSLFHICIECLLHFTSLNFSLMHFTCIYLPHLSAPHLTDTR